MFSMSILLLAFWVLGCQKATNSAEESPIHVENEHVLVPPGSPPAGAISVETSKTPDATVLSLNRRIV